MYIARAAEEDIKMTEGWKGDADGILVFTGLFSATVATFLVGSYQNLQPTPQDISAFHIANMYRLLADPNATSVPNHFALATSVPATSPKASVIWINILWSLSLLISLSCALLATLLQRWARHYLQVTQRQYSPHKRARIRAYFAEGVDSLRLPWVVEALPALLHVSVFLFFAGLVVFVASLNHLVFASVALCISACICQYLCITAMPLVRHDSPYHTPLSPFFWSCCAGVSWMALRFAENVAYSLHLRDLLGGEKWLSIDRLKRHFRGRFFHGMVKSAEETARALPPSIDTRALFWTWEAIDEDDELERFFAGIPSFCTSSRLQKPREVLVGQNAAKLSAAIADLMARTMSSAALSGPDKQKRITVCLQALSAVPILTENVLYNALVGVWPSFWSSIDFCLFAEAHSRDVNQSIAFHAQCVVAIAMANIRHRDERWRHLAMRQLDTPETVFQNYLAHGETILLANLIRGINMSLASPRALLESTLSAVCTFQAKDALPEVQAEFCTLWNQAARTMHDKNLPQDARSYAQLILRGVRGVYLASHQGMAGTSPTAFTTTTSILDPILWQTSSYPTCHSPAHRHPSPPSASCEVGYAAVATVSSHAVEARLMPIPPTLPTDGLNSTSGVVETTQLGAVTNGALSPMTSSLMKVAIVSESSPSTSATSAQGGVLPNL
ncbi:hypothetical protein BC834DRAFT_550524 [Gloeopeniophorella convolvens]|nr:hypothetical protein BC834DRAFT_672561 [Gloeopeniophorella convolvens]KAI0260271.1 hypothetical protein BC834DRAFT_550524 [Gloeopeniophorella convolvens]